MVMNNETTVTRLKLQDIKPNPENPRTISKDKLEKLVQSLKEFPEMLDKRPIVVNADHVILGGNMRLQALKKAGILEVPVMVADWPEEKQQEFIIKDNLAFGEWDWEMLASDWDADLLEDWGMDVSPFITDQKEAVEDDYEVPDEIETDIVPGDLIEIGRHRLLCYDATNYDDCEILMNGQKADMVFTDPPYNINYGNIKHPKFKARKIENDNLSKNEFKSFCRAFIANISKLNKGCVYIAGAPGSDGRLLFSQADELLTNSTVIIWNKDTFTLGRGKYQNKYEPIWFGWVDSGKKFYGDRSQSNVWDVERPKSSKEHPTMKPITLVSKAINHASIKDDIVLDLFLGSGSTMVAAHQLDRICYGMEIDPKYCQVIIDRIIRLDPEIDVKINGKEYGK